MPTFRPGCAGLSYIVATGWKSVNMNDHNINSQPRNTESWAHVLESVWHSSCKQLNSVLYWAQNIICMMCVHTGGASRPVLVADEHAGAEEMAGEHLSWVREAAAGPGPEASGAGQICLYHWRKRYVPSTHLHHSHRLNTYATPSGYILMGAQPKHSLSSSSECSHTSSRE